MTSLYFLTYTLLSLGVLVVWLSRRSVYGAAAALLEHDHYTQKRLHLQAAALEVEPRKKSTRSKKAQAAVVRLRDQANTQQAIQQILERLDKLNDTMKADDFSDFHGASSAAHLHRMNLMNVCEEIPLRLQGNPVRCRAVATKSGLWRALQVVNVIDANKMAIHGFKPSFRTFPEADFPNEKEKQITPFVFPEILSRN